MLYGAKLFAHNRKFHRCSNFRLLTKRFWLHVVPLVRTEIPSYKIVRIDLLIETRHEGKKRFAKSDGEIREYRQREERRLLETLERARFGNSSVREAGN